MASLPLVLVHGGAHGAWCWQPTIDLLNAPAVAIDLPPKEVRGVPSVDPPPPELATITLDDWARSAIADIDAAGIEELVLVGHSMGGLTISEVAGRIPARVKHLVFVSCMVPPEGGLVLDGVPHESMAAARERLTLDDGTGGHGGVGLEIEMLKHMFCNDMTDQQTQFVLDHTGTEVGAVFGERVSRRAIPPDLPKTYVRLLRDQALTPSDQDRAIEQLRDAPGGALEVIELDTGHDVMISAPNQLAPLLDQVAASAS